MRCAHVRPLSVLLKRPPHSLAAYMMRLSAGSTAIPLTRPPLAALGFEGWFERLGPISTIALTVCAPAGCVALTINR